MPVHNEPLNRGLYNRADPTLIPEGALQTTANARYKIGDGAIFQAEGRTEVDQVDGTVTHSGDLAGIDNVVFVEWDDGTTVDGTVPELTQLIYHGLVAGGGSNGVVSIPVKNDPGDDLMRRSVARTWSPPTGVTPGTGTTPWQAVHFEGAHVILTGGDNLFFKRAAGGQSVIQHGFPEATLAMYVSATIGGTGTESYVTGTHVCWFTWYDSVNDVESTAALPSTGANQGFGGWTEGYVVVPGFDTDATIGARFAWNTTNFGDAKPFGATHVRIYKAPIQSFVAAGEEPTTVPWPTGFRIAEVAIADLVNDTLNLGGGGLVAAKRTVEIDTLDEDAEESLVGLPAFESISISVSGEASTFTGLRGQPPDATTGDVFEESLCLNVVTDPRKMRFSFPGEPHAFPVTYFINFETARRDEIVCIKTLGNVLGVFLNNQVWRVNWLPSQTDFNFARGRVKDRVSASVGAGGVLAVTEMDLPGIGVMLAFADRNGMYLTDLTAIYPVSTHIDWRVIRGSVTGLADAALINNPDEMRLELYIPTTDLVWLFHYDQAHLTQGDRGEFVMAVTGGLTRAAGITTAVAARKENGAHVTISTNPGSTGQGFGYEGEGFTDGLSTSPTVPVMSIRTRELFLTGPMNEAQVRRFATHYKLAGNAGTGDTTATLNAIAKASTSTDAGVATEPSGRSLQIESTDGGKLGEAFSVSIAGEAAILTGAINFVAIEFDEVGPSQQD